MHVSREFIDELFTDGYFQEKLINFRVDREVQLLKNAVAIEEEKPIKLDKVIEDINETLYTVFKEAISKECNYLYESNTFILSQMQAIKTKLAPLPSHHLSHPSSLQENKHQLSTSIFFDPQNDLNLIRQNMNSLQSQLDVNHKSLIHSFQLYEENNQHKEMKELQFEIDQKVSERIKEVVKKVEQEMKSRAEKFELSVQQKVEQLKKTITKVVEAMNDPQFWINHNNPELINDETKINTHQNCPSEIESPLKLNTTLNDSVVIEKKFPSPSSSNKAMDSLNKSFNFGKTKIKSLFGFKSSFRPSMEPVV